MSHAPKTTRVVGAIALFSLAAALVAVAACENQTGTYVYRGRQYDPKEKCLGATRALDVIDLTTEPALCAPVCLVQTKYDGGEAVYVSNVCPPYPPDFDTSGSNALCPEALVAADNASGCVPQPPDAGPDAAPDATVEDAAPTDASDAAPLDGAPADASDGAPTDAGTDADDASG